MKKLVENMTMKNSFRLEMLVASVVSLLLALLTEIIIVLLLYNFSTVMGKWQVDKKPSRQQFEANLQESKNIIDRKKSFSEKDEIYDRFINAYIRPMGKETMECMMIGSIILGIVLFAAYFLLFTRKIRNDLIYVAEGVHDIAMGDMEKKLVLNRQDEIGIIAEQVNEMSAEIKRLLASERESDQQKKDLITSVAHDLKTPLTSIIGYLELAASVDKYDVETRQEYVGIANRKAHRLENLIEDLFNYTKLSTGEITLKKVELDVVRLVEQMIEEFYPIFQENGLQYQFSAEIDSLLLEADGELLARAVQNLLSNAIKYGKDGKKVLISLETKGRWMLLTVTNFGMIIPKESLDMIFERFYRVENSRSRETGGTGLGLNIVKEIVELHEGKIEADSSLEGTRFRMYLPLLKKKEEQEAD